MLKKLVKLGFQSKSYNREELVLVERLSVACVKASYCQPASLQKVSTRLNGLK